MEEIINQIKFSIKENDLDKVITEIQNDRELISIMVGYLLAKSDENYECKKNE